MKPATGLCVWVSLLAAAGTVRRSASQSGGWRFRPAPRPWGRRRLALPSPSLTPPAPRLSAEQGPRHWVLFLGLSVASHHAPKLSICVCKRFISGGRGGENAPLCAPLSLSAVLKTLVFSHVFWEPERDPFRARRACGTGAPQAPRERRPGEGAWETRAARARRGRAGVRGARGAGSGARRTGFAPARAAGGPGLGPLEPGRVRPNRSLGRAAAGGRALAPGPGTPGFLARRPGAVPGWT